MPIGCRQRTQSRPHSRHRLFTKRASAVVLHRKTVMPPTRCISDQKLRANWEFKCNLKLR